MLCSHFQDNQCKNISKFEREDESNGIPLVQHGICFFFHENFPVNIHSDSFPFFIMLYSYFLSNECRKKFEIKEETLKQWKPTCTQRIWQKLCWLNRFQFKALMCCMPWESVRPTERAYHVNSIRHMERAYRGASRTLRERPRNNYVVQKMMGRSKGRSFEKLRYSN